MELWLLILLLVIVFGCGRKSTGGRRCDLAFVALILSAVYLLAQTRG